MGAGNAVHYELRAADLSNSYYSLAAFHALQGFTVDETNLPRWRVQESHKAAVADAAGYFDATRLDHRCTGDLRLRPPGTGALMVAAELLCFGTGALRPAGYAVLHAYEFAEYGRLTSPLEVVYAWIRALYCGPGSSVEQTGKEIYCSTNILYGDALGELEQLWERRADTEFLDAVARYLQRVNSWRESPAPAHAPLNYEAVVRAHLRAQSVWRTAPSNGRALLRRIEFILEHLIIDNSPGLDFDAPGRRCRKSLPNSGVDRHQDRSGYDGWLSDTSMGLN
jgi:hypothetical protein